MSTRRDDPNLAAWKGTLYLVEQARSWERVARDESLEPETRVCAAERARAVRQELRP